VRPSTLERIDADLCQPLDVFNCAQVLGIHDVGAVLVFQHRHQLIGMILARNHVHLVSEGMAQLRTAVGERALA